jgi:hypothetical protein
MKRRYTAKVTVNWEKSFNATAHAHDPYDAKHKIAGAELSRFPGQSIIVGTISEKPESEEVEHFLNTLFKFKQ